VEPHVCKYAGSTDLTIVGILNDLCRNIGGLEDIVFSRLVLNDDDIKPECTVSSKRHKFSDCF
jgi:hypothetical protein